MTRSMAQLKVEFMREGLLMCFNGPFSHELIEELGSAIRAHLAGEQLAHAALMDLFAVFVELTQNVRNYTQRMPLHGHDPAELHTALVTIGKQGEKYWVHSGNYVAVDELPTLLARFEALNGLGKEELRRLYKSQLRQEAPSPHGAGLGLIDMARRMTEPFTVAVEEVDAQFAFFSVRVTV
jgi:hypothetical protein